MRSRRTKGQALKVSVATLAFLLVSLNSPPTTPSTADGLIRPTPAEVCVLEELAEWVLGHPISEDFRVFDDVDMTSVVRNRPQSFELFRQVATEKNRSLALRDFPFGDLVQQSAQRHEIDGFLLVAMMEAESGFDPDAVSLRGALGLMQVMPSTAEHYKVVEPLDPAANIDLGARYMSSLLERFDGDVALALAGYNAGPSTVRRYGGIPPYSETRVYVDRVLTRYVDHHQSLWQSSGAQYWLF